MQPITQLKEELSSYGLELTDEQISDYIKGLIGDDEFIPSLYDQILVDIMTQNKLGFGMDWKWACNDVMDYIKECVPDFTYTNEANNDSDEEAHNFKGSVLGSDLNMNFGDSPVPLVEAVNEIIKEKIDKVFVEMPSMGDDYRFILVPQNLAAQTSEKHPVDET